eukprot:760891-Hanusia_phi.AAC.3
MRTSNRLSSITEHSVLAAAGLGHWMPCEPQCADCSSDQCGRPGGHAAAPVPGARADRRS